MSDVTNYFIYITTAWPYWSTDLQSRKSQLRFYWGLWTIVWEHQISLNTGMDGSYNSYARQEGHAAPKTASECASDQIGKTRTKTSQTSASLMRGRLFCSLAKSAVSWEAKQLQRSH